MELEVYHTSSLDANKMTWENKNKIFDKRFRLGILPNAKNLQLPIIPRPPEKTPLLVPEAFDTYDDIDGGGHSHLRVDVGRANEPRRQRGDRDTTDNYFPLRKHGLSSYNTSGAAKAQTGGSIFMRLVNALKENSSNIVNLIIVIAILVTESLVQGNLFTCPCEAPANVYYGSAFLAAPAVAFFVLGIMVNNTTWILATGCLDRKKKPEIPITSNCHHVIGVCMRAIVAPLAWLIVGFIDGQFYECAAAHPPCLGSEAQKRNLRAESQLIGYITMMVAMVVAILGAIAQRSTRKLNYEQDKYVRIYREVELQVMQEAFTVHARERARQNIQEFLANNDKMKSQEAWDAISRPSKANQGWNTPGGELAGITSLDEAMKQQRSKEKTRSGEDSAYESKNTVKM